MIHRRSKISRLPQAAITYINESLDANLEYARILDWLREQGYRDIEHYHLSRWRNTGYQDWLNAEEHQAALDRQLRWVGTCAAEECQVGLLHTAAMNLIIVKLFDAINALAEHRAKARQGRFTEKVRRKLQKDLRRAMQIPAVAIPGPVPEPEPPTIATNSA